jgi:hypothetical protein
MSFLGMLDESRALWASSPTLGASRQAECSSRSRLNNRHQGYRYCSISGYFRYRRLPEAIRLSKAQLPVVEQFDSKTTAVSHNGV